MSEHETGRQTRPPAVSVRGLEKRYGDGDDAVVAVDEVDLTVESGTVVGLLGPNGAGKTTVIKSILSLILPDSGSVEVDGFDTYEEPQAVHQRVGATLEGARNTYWRLTVAENVEHFSALGGNDPTDRREFHEELLERFSLTEKADEPVRHLSRGEKQKAALACTMAREPEIVFLDEPTLGLDVEASLDLRTSIRTFVEERGMTVLVSSHDMEVVEAVCDRVVILSSGEVVADDTVESLLSGFSAQAYEVVVEGTVPDETERELGDQFGAEAFEHRAGRTQFDVQVTDDEFYDLVATLRKAGLAVRSFDSTDPDLEEVFLQITQQAAARREVSP